MAGVSIDWASPPDALAGNVESYWNRVEAALERELRIAGDQILSYAQSAHPWQNRTGEAEEKLRVEITVGDGTLELALGHGAAHGIYLEKRWAGRWGVIPAALTMGYPLVMRAAMAALRG